LEAVNFAQKRLDRLLGHKYRFISSVRNIEMWLKSFLAADEHGEGTAPTGLADAVSKAAVDRFAWGLATEVGKQKKLSVFVLGDFDRYKAAASANR
jgi:hypothetical protein